MPRLSIIIPSFNSLNLLRECLDSIKEQSFKEYEVIIIDGQSTDGTIDFLKTLNTPYFWKSEPDNGIYDAMNKGIDVARGEWLYFLGCDDLLYDKNTLETVFHQKIDDHSSLLIGKVKYDFGPKDSLLIKKNKGTFQPSWSKKIWFKNTVHHQGVFYKRDLFRTQKYSLDYKILSDYDFNLKLFKRKINALIISQVIAISKTQGVSKNYNWKLYTEEINLKTKQSSIILKPLFYVLAVGKYILKKSV